MNNLKKLLGNISKLLFALILALLLFNVTSCDLGIVTPGSEPSSPTSPDDNNTQPTTPTSYHDFANFNPANYPIENKTGKPDSEYADMKDIIWLTYAENEYAGDWTANYIKTNKIKTILSDGTYGQAWVDPDYLDRFYLNEEFFSWVMSGYNDKQYNDNDRANMRRQYYNDFFMHETMHIVQWKSGAFNLMKGMRPDICAAAEMLVEYLAWFYTSRYQFNTYVYADMENAVEKQSKYMILSTDPDAYDAARAKDPSLPEHLFSRDWFQRSNISSYAQIAFLISVVRENAMALPLRQASKEDMLKLARALLACRDPKMAGVTDDALWTVFDALRNVAVGRNKYLDLSESGVWSCKQEYFDNFQDFISDWDTEYALSINPPVITIEYSNFSDRTNEEIMKIVRDLQIVYNDNINGFRTEIESHNMP